MRGLKWLLAAALFAATVTVAAPVAQADEPAATAAVSVDAISALKNKDALLTARLKDIAKNTDNASAWHCHRRWGCGYGWGCCGWGGWGCYRPAYCYAPAFCAPVCYARPACYAPAVSYYAPAVYAPVSFVSYGGFGGCFYW